MLGFSEVMLVLLFATLMLGPDKMPGIVRSWVRTVAAWRLELQKASDELHGIASGIEETATDVKHELSMPELRRQLDEVRAELVALRDGTAPTPGSEDPHRGTYGTLPREETPSQPHETP
jgi:Sec-independent protein translocase protein TatA